MDILNFSTSRLGALTALTIAAALSGCTQDSGIKAFSMPADWFGRSGGYTYSDLQETVRQRPVSANDLVQENGACAAPPAMAQPAPPASPPGSPNNPGPVPAAAPNEDSLLGGGIALGMTECDVVYRAGQPNGIQLGKNPNGLRTAVMTYGSGPRPGVYHFEAGRLMQMDRVVEPAPPPVAKKKRPVKSAKPQKKDNQA